MARDKNGFDEQKNKAKSVEEELKESMSDASSATSDQAESRWGSTRDKGADGLESLVSSAESSASDFQEQQREGLASYVSEMASGADNLAESIRHKSVDELIQEAEGLARKSPALFLAGSVAIGLCISRFAKSSQGGDNRIHGSSGF